MIRYKREYRDTKIGKERKCCICKKWLPVSKFYKRDGSPDGLRADCKICFSKPMKLLYQRDKDRILKRNKRYYEKNKEKINKYKSDWQKENRERRNKRLSERYKNEPNYRIAVNLRNRLLIALKNNQRRGSTLELLGCSVDFFRKYMEDKFVSDMSWTNHGKIWHIDHIKPCAKFNLSDESQQRICFHYTNMQPLYVLDNLVKGDR